MYVDLEKQASLCFSASFTYCPLPFEPRKLPVKPLQTIPAWLKRGLVAALIALAVWALYMFGYPLFTQPAVLLPPTGTELSAGSVTRTAQQPALTSTSMAAASATGSPPTATVTPTSTTVPTSTATPTNTPRPAPATAGPQAGTPFGPQGEYILHVIQEADSLNRIAGLYNTSVEVLRAVNEFDPIKALWPGQVIVVQPGVTEPEGVVRFRIVELKYRWNVDDLAEEYGVTAEDLRRYNNLGPEAWVPAGRILIVPVE